MLEATRTKRLRTLARQQRLLPLALREAWRHRLCLAMMTHLPHSKPQTRRIRYRIPQKLRSRPLTQTRWRKTLKPSRNRLSSQSIRSNQQFRRHQIQQSIRLFMCIQLDHHYLTNTMAKEVQLLIINLQYVIQNSIIHKLMRENKSMSQ